MKKAFLAIAVLALTGCGAVQKVSNVHNHIQYIRDERTGLCFGVLHFSGYNTTGLSIASVPCSPEVTALLGKE